MNMKPFFFPQYSSFENCVLQNTLQKHGFKNINFPKGKGIAIESAHVTIGQG